MAAFDDVLEAARTLSVDDQIRLIDRLQESFPPSDEWLAEVQRRSAEYDAGKVTASPWSEVRERVRRRAGLEQ